MAYDQNLEQRITEYLLRKKIVYHSKKMMGGLCYMIDDKMCIGIVGNDLMVRVHPDSYARLLQLKGAKLMNFTGREMKGYLFVEPEGIDFEEDLAFWIEACLAFNPLAKRSKK